MAKMPEIEQVCPNCGEIYKAPSDWVGGKVECPACKTAFTVRDTAQQGLQRVGESRQTSPFQARSDRIPSRWNYVIGLAILAVGFIFFVVFLITQIFGIAPEIQLVVPGSHEIHLARPGEYTVFYEYQSFVNGKTLLTGRTLSAVSTTLKAKKDGREIRLSKPSVRSTYSVGGRAGVAVLAFQIDDPGTYLFTANYSDGSTGPDVVFAIGQFKLLGAILGGIGIFLGTIIGSGFIIVRTFLKRRKAGPGPVQPPKALPGKPPSFWPFVAVLAVLMMIGIALSAFFLLMRHRPSPPADETAAPEKKEIPLTRAISSEPIPEKMPRDRRDRPLTLQDLVKSWSETRQFSVGKYPYYTDDGGKCELYLYRGEARVIQITLTDINIHRTPDGTFRDVSIIGVEEVRPEDDAVTRINKRKKILEKISTTSVIAEDEFGDASVRSVDRRGRRSICIASENRLATIACVPGIRSKLKDEELLRFAGIIERKMKNIILKRPASTETTRPGK